MVFLYRIRLTQSTAGSHVSYTTDSVDSIFKTDGITLVKTHLSTHQNAYHREFQPVSHQPCGSRAPVRVDKFLDFVRQPHGVVYYTARLSYEKQGRKAATTNFRHVHFLCDLLAFSERCTTGARHTRLRQDCCKTRKVFVRLTL